MMKHKKYGVQKKINFASLIYLFNALPKLFDVLSFVDDTIV